MTKEIIIAGFGGQGIVSSGIILGYAGMLENKNVTFFPSYGAEMRGGTANCSVVISSEPVASPIVAYPDILIIMNEPSLARFEPMLKPGGIFFYNKTLIKSHPKRDDITVLAIEANAIAEELGQGRIANMVMLGALVKKTDILKLETLKKAQRERFVKASSEQLSLNDKALERGSELY
ncbi:2-oxoacid:ferredoxin oxidoreductase subunit gamma [candidate division WOR_3 bacterium SM23_42]|uniref:2-oxoacid:ferredoxin oxidoreductase subunit gamma n=1 Tax=candidate division WOR_3 bacterium SM23_42 TaxID=1703779 RepID=A0A0S8FTC9_UNCW3|nr:MAG: 2-oxoacid:ferredoxin oxidoreductase subunit gamma [candidate division WOR_3 bacterium SM23_42]